MKSTKTMIYIMMIVLFAGAMYLFATGHDDQGALKGIDPESYDIVTACNELDGNTLLCNEGNDMYLVLNGTKVYKEKMDISVDKKGDVKIEKIFSDINVSDLEKAIKDTGSVMLRLWMTPNGKIDCIMMVEENIINKSESLKALEGLDLNSYNSVNVVTAMDEKTITLAPVKYTEENKDKLAQFIKVYDFSEKPDFYHIDLTEKVTKKDGKEVRELKNVKYSKCDLNMTKEYLNDSASVYVWFDKVGNVSDIVTISLTNNSKEGK